MAKKGVNVCVCVCVCLCFEVGCFVLSFFSVATLRLIAVNNGD